MIYVITTMKVPNPDNIDWVNHNKRTVGWWPDLRGATEIVRSNCGDIYEGDQNYAVIELIGKGLYPIPEGEWWYRWETDGYVPTNKPNGFRTVCNFGIG